MACFFTCLIGPNVPTPYNWAVLGVTRPPNAPTCLIGPNVPTRLIGPCFSTCLLGPSLEWPVRLMLHLPNLASCSHLPNRAVFRVELGEEGQHEGEPRGGLRGVKDGRCEGSEV